MATIKIKDNETYSEEINLGNGNDKVIIGKYARVNTPMHLGNGKNTITAGIESWLSRIYTGSGRDTVKLGDKAKIELINLGDGTNYLQIGNSEKDFRNIIFSIETGNNNDTIKLGNYITVGSDSYNPYTIDGIEMGNGKNSLTVGNNSHISTINGGINNDSVKLGDYTSVSEVNLYGGNNTFTAGSGKEEYDRTVIDSINAYWGDDTVKLGNYVDVGFIFLNGGNNSITVGNNSEIKTILTSSGDDTVKLGNNVSVSYTDFENETISINLGDGKNSITAGSGSEEIHSNIKKIQTGKDYDTVKLGDFVNVNEVDLGDGKNSFTVGSGTDYDRVFIDTINTGSGNDTVKLGNFINVNTINTGSGNDTVKLGNNVAVNSINLGAGKNSLTIGENSYINEIHVNGDDTVKIGKDADGTIIYTGTGTCKIDVKETSNRINYSLEGGNTTIVSKAAINNVNLDDSTWDFGTCTMTVKKDSTVELYCGNDYKLGYEIDKNDLIVYKRTDDTEYGAIRIKDYYKNRETITLLVNDDITKPEYMQDIFQGTGSVDKFTNVMANDIVNAGEGKDIITVSNGTFDKTTDIIEKYDVENVGYVYNFSTPNCVTANGEGGNDTIKGGKYIRNDLNGGFGNDTIKGGNSAYNNIIGGAGDDVITAGSGDKNAKAVNYISGNAGNDKIKIGSNSYNEIKIESGNDTVTVSGKNNYNVFDIDTYTLENSTLKLSKSDTNILKYNSEIGYSFENLNLWTTNKGKDLYLQIGSIDGKQTICIKNYNSVKNSITVDGDDIAATLSEILAYKTENNLSKQRSSSISVEEQTNESSVEYIVNDVQCWLNANNSDNMITESNYNTENVEDLIACYTPTTNDLWV